MEEDIRGGAVRAMRKLEAAEEVLHGINEAMRTVDGVTQSVLEVKTFVSKLTLSKSPIVQASAHAKTEYFSIGETKKKWRASSLAGSWMPTLAASNKARGSRGGSRRICTHKAEGACTSRQRWKQ